MKTKIGIDQRGDLCCVARVDYQTGRAEVKALARFQPAHLKGHHLLAGGEQIVAIPDDQAIVKQLYAPAHGDHDGKTNARFELLQGLLDAEDQFQIDIVATGQTDRYVGIALRRDAAAALTAQLGAEAHQDEIACRPRAMALGLGYNMFCRADGGDLVAVVDFTKQSAGICYLFQGRIVGLAHMSLGQFDLEDDDDIAQMMLELKTIINFKLAALADDGITVPLSLIAVSGDSVSDKMKGTMSRTFSSTVASPVISAGFFPDRSDLSKIPLDSYLVALGLTV
jgi:hypothetical protein